MDLPSGLADVRRRPILWYFSPLPHRFTRLSNSWCGRKCSTKLLVAADGFCRLAVSNDMGAQHVASAGCVVPSAYLLMRLARQPSALVIIARPAVGTAGFESSTWAGGFVFGAAAPSLLLFC